MMLAAFALLVQQQNSVPSSAGSASGGQSDVVVTGINPASPEETKGVETPDAQQAIANGIRFDKSRIFARCLRDIPAEALRKIIDGPPNLASTRFAQGWLVSKHVTCDLALDTAPFDPLSAGDSIFDRGALLEQVLAHYAPDAALSRAQTQDRAVQRRFDAREVPRNRYRSPVDYNTFAIAVCLVRMQPEATVSLLHTEPGAHRESELERGIVGRARICVGEARKVTFDTVKMRLYLIDALYRWIVAARGVDSLITDEPMNPR